ncbi:MAG: hypothetical protein PHC85_02285 [Candidatus Pacebacteria bacterium]|nr:hypothetical protein [Candidatus Paceibacterota bacterium]
MGIKFKNLLKIKKPRIGRGLTWRLGLIAFFFFFVVIFVLNLRFLGRLQESLNIVAEEKDFSIESVEFDLLTKISENMVEKESAFEKYKQEVPNINDPSI